MRASTEQKPPALGPRPELSVVIPAWNERENLDLLLPALRETLQDLGVRFEIIVADAGSTDGTRESAERRGARVVVLILGTPDYGKWMWWVIESIYGKVLPGAYAGEHITHFTQATLAARLRPYGHEILDCRYVRRCEMIFKARKPASLAVAQPEPMRAAAR